MAESYVSVLDALDGLFVEIKDSYYIKKILFSKWSSIDYNFPPNFAMSTGELIGYDKLANSLTNDYIKKIRDLSAFRPIKEKLPLEYDYISKIVDPTLDLLNSIFQTKSIFTKRSMFLKEEILQIFTRLTHYPPGSMVSMKDLVKDESFTLFYTGSVVTPSQERERIMEYKYGLEGILYTLMKMHTHFPAPYYYKINTFERTDQLNSVIRELELKMILNKSEKE